MTTTPIEDYAKLTRQQLTFVACDALAVLGKKPSVALVREQSIAIAGIKKGSDGDVQEDIRLWYDGLFALKRDAAIDGLPEQMATLFRATWRAAVEMAAQGVAAEREQLALKGVQMLAKVEHAQAEVAVMQHQLDLAVTEAGGRNAAITRLDETIARRDADIAQCNARLAAKDERIEALTAELARNAAEQAAAVSQLDGARRHALLQIDQARVEARRWEKRFEGCVLESKAAKQAADADAAAANKIEAKLAGARARIELLEENIQGEIARSAALAVHLVDTQNAVSRLSDQLNAAHIVSESNNARLEVAIRERDDAKMSADEARGRELRAVEQAAEFRGALTKPARRKKLAD